MSSFKQLNKADVTTVPYAANKRWSFYFTSSPSNGITFYRGTKSTFSPTNPTSSGQYNSLMYDFINHMYYQSYSGSLLDTGSLMFNVNTYESASQQRPTSSYFIYNDSPQLIKNFPSESGDSISVISVSPKIFGSKILPHSFALSASSVFIVDDGYGNLFDIDQATDDYVVLDYVSSSYFTDPTPDSGSVFVGNIFYAQGLVVITSQNTDYLDLLDPASTPPVQISFQNEHIIYENEVRCIVKESDFNLSYNPSLLKYGAQLTTASVDISPISIVSTFIPGSPRYIKTTFTYDSPVPYDITINYTVDYNFSIFSSTVSSSVILPAGQSTVTNFIVIAPAISSFNSTTITSTTYKQYELLDSTVKDFATGSIEFSGSYSYFQPYTTTIGLYNDNNDLLMVAKLAKPIALSSDTDMTFIVRYDT